MLISNFIMVWANFDFKATVFEDLGFQAEKPFALNFFLIRPIDRVLRETYRKPLFKVSREILSEFSTSKT